MFLFSILELGLFATPKDVITVMNMVKRSGFGFVVASGKHPLAPLCSEGRWRGDHSVAARGGNVHLPFQK